MAAASAGVGIKILRRKDTGAYQIIGVLPGGPAKTSGMVQENDTLVKARRSPREPPRAPALLMHSLVRAMCAAPP